MAAARRASAPEKLRPSIFWVLATMAVPLVGYFARLEVEGRENLPATGPYVLAPNHNSEFDPLVMAVAVWRMGRQPRFLAKESLFRVPFVSWVLRVSEMVPVARSSSAAGARQTLETAERLVAKGQGLIVYPEGTLTRDPDLWPMRGKTGAVRLALEGGIPVIPCAQWGVQKIMPRYGRLSLRPRRRVRFILGPPVDLSAYEGQTNRPANLVAATDTVMAAIAGLLGRLRGEAPPAERWNPSQHGQAETGRLEP